MAFEQQNRLLSLSTPLGKDAFILTRFSGSEGITRESRFTLSALSENKQLSALDLIGKAVNFDIELLDGTYRVFNGIVEAVAAEGIVNKDYRRYEFTVVSRLSLLKKKTDTRIFQHQSLLDTIKAVLDEHHVDHRSLLIKSYPTQLYCTQYNETDFDFVHRLLKEAGISYRFEHETGKHTLVLFDHTGGYVANTEAEHDYVDGTSGKADYHGWSKRLQFPSGRTAQRSFNFLDPYNPVAHQQDTLLPISQAKGYERYQYPALNNDSSLANAESERSIESQENEYSRVSVNSHCRTLAPGQTFGFNRHLIDDEVGPQHAIVSIQYTAQDDTYLNQPGATQELTCHLNCIPKESVYRDTRDYPRPSVKGIQTAIISGPNGEEIYTDEHGRLKVQFHWDRQGKRNEDSSCWIRVNQRVAGPGWGDQHLPRIGQEAVIQFEDNDINKPIILGTLYNGKNRPAYKLPQNKTQSGIKTRSSKGATPDQFNEIRFEDKRDNEELYIQAQKDHNMLVKHDQSRAIGNDQYVSVGNNRSEIIKKSRQSVIAEGSDKLQVEQEINIQSVKAGIILEADKFIELRTGKSVITLQSNGKIIIKAVQVDIDGTKGVNLNGGQSPGSKRLKANKAKNIFTTPTEGGAAIPKIKVTPVEMMTVTKVDVNAKSRAAMPKFIKTSSANGLMKTHNKSLDHYVDNYNDAKKEWDDMGTIEKGLYTTKYPVNMPELDIASVVLPELGKAREQLEFAKRVYDTMPDSFSVEDLAQVAENFNDLANLPGINGAELYDARVMRDTINNIYAPNQARMSGMITDIEKDYFAELRDQKLEKMNDLGFAFGGVFSVAGIIARNFGAPPAVVESFTIAGVNLGTAYPGTRTGRGIIKPVGVIPNPRLSQTGLRDYPFGSFKDNFTQHSAKVDVNPITGKYVIKNGSISGGHNADEFYKVLDNTLGDGVPALRVGDPVPVVNHSGVQVGETIAYKVPQRVNNKSEGPKVGVAKRDADGNVMYRNKEKYKTVYYPDKISDEQMAVHLQKVGDDVFKSPQNVKEVNDFMNSRDNSTSFDHKYDGFNHRVHLHKEPVSNNVYIGNIHLK